ncbi:hypothetical protein [Pandoraea sp. SD6-2]|uniref:hypothetical protein n=1 Tax=Pandoraea sp. SD6-2 TaxID=1286093 RepID=UPI001186B526|nr:hypothetical protein [Pandoraea sp. SD6-2]
MSTAPKLLLDCAKRIHESGTCEATRRAVASRAYYAGYHAAKQFHESLATPGFVKETKGRHQQLLSQLAFPGISENNKKHNISIALGKMLRPAYELRVTADYFLNDEVSDVDVAQALKGCEDLIAISEKYVAQAAA